MHTPPLKNKIIKKEFPGRGPAKATVLERDILRSDLPSDADLATEIGLAYFDSELAPPPGKTKEQATAFWWEKAAEQGYAQAQNGLGYLYDRDLIAPPKGQTPGQAAAFWWKKAAEQGHADAQYNLGCLYTEKHIDPPEGQTHAQAAAFWWKKAAEQEIADAQYNLGCLYNQKRIDPLQGQTHAQATAFCWQKAAEQGHTKAQNDLEYLYDQDLIDPPGGQTHIQATDAWDKLFLADHYFSKKQYSIAWYHYTEFFALQAAIPNNAPYCKYLGQARDNLNKCTKKMSGTEMPFFLCHSSLFVDAREADAAPTASG